MSDLDPIEAVERLYALAMKRCHWKSGACEYDDIGTMSSGMGSKPCSKYRSGREDWWCYACRLDATGIRAALPALVALREERDHWKGNYAELLGSTVRDDRSHLAGITESYQRGYEEHIEAERALRARVLELASLCEEAAEEMDRCGWPDEMVERYRRAAKGGQ